MKKSLIIILTIILFIPFNNIAMKRSLNKSFSQKRKKQKVDIFNLIKNNNYEKVKKSINYSSNIVNIKNSNELTPLHYATEKGYFEIVELFINNYANINTKGSLIYNFCGTPLHTAIENHNFKIAELLVNNRANVNSKNNFNNTPLVLISRMRNLSDDKNIIDVKIAELLINNGAHVNIKDNKGNTPLHWAVYHGNTEIVKLLINKGAKINRKYAESLLFNAIDAPLLQKYEEGHYYEIAKFLIKNEAKVNVKNYKKQTPLDYAIQKGSFEIARLLIENGANMNIKGGKNNEQLYLAIKEGYCDIVKLLINKGANINIKNTHGESPLHYAAKEGHKNIIRLLIATPHSLSLLKQEKNKKPKQEKNKKLFLTYFLKNSIKKYKCKLENPNKERLKKLFNRKPHKFMFNLLMNDKKPAPLSCLNLIADNLFGTPFKNQIELRNVKVFLKQCFINKDIKINESEFKYPNAEYFINLFYTKHHLPRLKQYINIKNNNNKTAIGVAKTPCIVTYLEKINKAHIYENLPEKLKNEIQDNYKMIFSKVNIPLLKNQGFKTNSLVHSSKDLRGASFLNCFSNCAVS